MKDIEMPERPIAIVHCSECQKEVEVYWPEGAVFVTARCDECKKADEEENEKIERLLMERFDLRSSTAKFLFLTIMTIVQAIEHEARIIKELI